MKSLPRIQNSSLYTQWVTWQTIKSDKWIRDPLGPFCNGDTCFLKSNMKEIAPYFWSCNYPFSPISLCLSR